MTAVDVGSLARELVQEMRAQGMTWAAIRRELGFPDYDTPRPYQPTTVPIEPLREAFKRSGMSPSEIAIRADWFDNKGSPNTRRVMESLGMKPYHDGTRGAGNYRRRLRIPTALTLGKALGLDPHEVGL